jgi:CelD/BcsL family acetyltransferase involved in cellulose biosynthesis
METFPMTSDLLISLTDPAWMSFLMTKSDASIFHHPAWSQLLAETYGYKPFLPVVSSSAGMIEAGVPMMEVNSPLTGRRWVSLPFSDYCYPLYNDDQALGQLINHIIALSNKEKISKTELRSVCPDTLGLYTFSDHVLHLADLEQDSGKVFRRVHEMHRRNIKVAMASEVQIVRGETQDQLREFYNLHLRTRRSQGVPVQPWRFFENLKSLLLDQNLGFLLLAYKDQRCIAGAIFLHWQSKLTYKYGASSDNALKFRPNNLLMWTAMQWGCENGYTCFDLGRSSISNTGLRTFKTRWGAQETLLKYTRLSPIPDLGNNNRLLNLMEIVLQKSPSWVCRLSGELLYKHFG